LIYFSFFSRLGFFFFSVLFSLTHFSLPSSFLYPLSPITSNSPTDTIEQCTSLFIEKK